MIAFSSDAGLTYSTFATAVGYPDDRHPADHRDLVGDQRVEPAQRADHVHPGARTADGSSQPRRSRASASPSPPSRSPSRIGALGNLVGTRIAGVDPVWDVTVTNMATIVLANVLGLLVGFMLGVLIRSSAGALVAYFVYSFLLPTLSIILANSQDWFRHLQPWVDFQYASGTLIDGTVTSQQWAHLATSATAWLALPLVVGLVLVTRAEVK